MKRSLLLAAAFVGILIFVIVLGAYMLNDKRDPIANIDSFDTCVAAGHPVQESFPAVCVVPGGKSFTQNIPQTRDVSFEGKVVCLPHKNTNGPQTLECAIGLKTDDGTYYALESEQADGPVFQAAGSARRVRVAGTLKERTSAIYPVKGQITVTEFSYVNN